MEFINENVLDGVTYENYPFPHVVIDNFLQNDKLDELVVNINNLKDKDADSKFINPKSIFEFNKFAYNKNHCDQLKELFIELNSEPFIKHLEKLTGINELITNDINLFGAGVHRIKHEGFLQLHTDFNSYQHEVYGKLDRRINLLIYMNPIWKEEYKGLLCLCDKTQNICVKKILPILNRCVIFNTSKESIHGHPEKLKVPKNIYRNSIAVYYYTKNNNGILDFEGDPKHSTVWYPKIKV
jgi:Rps23 Pro-64 3,4-dihydroxylase Tpa1-like proline 4-hydroxylase